MKALLKTTDRLLAVNVAELTQGLVAALTWRRDAGSTIERQRVEKPHVVFVDVDSDRLGAIAVLSAIKREDLGSAKVIAIIGEAPQAEAARLLDAGFDWVIRRPLSSADVAAVMRAAEVLALSRLS